LIDQSNIKGWMDKNDISNYDELLNILSIGVWTPGLQGIVNIWGKWSGLAIFYLVIADLMSIKI